MRRLFIVVFTITLFLVGLFPVTLTSDVKALDPAFVLYPKIVSPAVEAPGDVFNIGFKSNVEVSSFTISISRVYDDNGELKYDSLQLEVLNVESSAEGMMNFYNITVKIPDNAGEGLYNIVIEYVKQDGSSDTFVEPDSLWVMNSTLDSITIMQVSDIHIGFEYESNQRLITALLLSRLLNPEPDIIIATGDNTDRASNIEAKTLRELLATYSIGKPKFFAPGNHDSRTKAYETHVGERSYYRVVGGKFLFVALDTGNFGRITYEEYLWFKDVLQKYSDLTKIVYFHHPIFGYDVQGTLNYTPDINENLIYGSWASNMSLTRATLQLMVDYGVNLVLSGHIHSDRIVLLNHDNGVTYFVTTTTLGASRPDYNGLRLITVFDNGSITLHHMPSWGRLDKYPNSIPVEYRESFERGLDSRGFPGKPIFRGIVSQDGDSLSFSMKIMSWLSLDGRLLLPIYTDRDVSEYSQYVSLSSSSDTSLVDKKRFNGVNYFLIDVSIDGGGELIFALSYFEDTEPPNLSVAYINPEKPAPNVPITVYFEASDAGWGVLKVPVEVTIESGGSSETILMEASFTGTLYLLSLDGYPDGTTLTLKPSAVDAGLNYVNLTEITIQVEAEKQEVYVPDVKVTDFKASNTTVKPGEEVTLTVELVNNGNATGEYTLEIYLNGELFNSTVITLEPGDSTTYSVVFTPDEEGTYEFTVDGYTLSINVADEAEAPEEAPEKPGEEPTGLGSTVYLVGVVVLIVLVSLLAFIFMKRR